MTDTNRKAQTRQRLWYDRPAVYWEEALPLGNGRLGAMLYSGVGEDTILLNEDTLWSGYRRTRESEMWFLITERPGIWRWRENIRNRRKRLKAACWENLRMPIFLRAVSVSCFRTFRTGRRIM